MKKKDALYELIKSLSQNEKRYFKIYASRHTIGEKNSYIRLFEAIDRATTSQSLKLKHKDKTNEQKARHAAEKNYLYNLILNCLDIYHREATIDGELGKNKNIAWILLHKKLDEQCIKILKKARNAAREHDRFEALIGLEALQKKSDFNQDNVNSEDIRTYYQRVFKALDGFRERLEYEKLFDELLVRRRRKGPVKNQEELENMKKTYVWPESGKDIALISFDIKMFSFLSKIEYDRIIKDADDCRLYCLKLIALFKEHKHRILDNLTQYIYVLNVFIVERLYLENREQAETMLAELKVIPSLIGERNLTTDIRVKLFEVYATCITDITIKFKDFKPILHHLPEIEEDLRKMDKLMTPSFNLVLKSNLACVYFGAGEYKQALKWCSIIINEAPVYREDIFYIVRMLNLLIHFELGNQLILPSQMKSTYRHLYKRRRIYKFETIFLNYLRLFLRAETKKEQKQLFISFRAALIPLLDDHFENLIFSDVDIIGWIDKRIMA